MMTSRCEYRLVLRQDNADLRLTEKSFNAGLATEERYKKLNEKIKSIQEEMERLKAITIKPVVANKVITKFGSTEINQGMSLFELLKRPEIGYKELTELDSDRHELREDIYKQCEVQIKYTGYIKKQLAQIEKFKQLEKKKLYADISYSSIDGLRIEARQKLDMVKPTSIGQASRISGVSPADISVLLIYLETIFLNLKIY
jgi:tRNA uridine 5-carboxymethylaminomethyl modification enzyme